MGWEHETKKAIVHVDADAFFASCEQALHPELKGKPVITGKERGIVSAASYEAKAMGVQRGVPLHEVKKICPEAIIVSSDYESYSLFSKRLFAILRRFTSAVEEYGIEESFCDITGLRRPLHMTYPQIAYAMKTTIERELDLSISVGLSVSKVLAKIGSKFDKPSGFVVIAKNNTRSFLEQTPVGDVWGIGRQTTALLNGAGIMTAAQFAALGERWIEEHLAKPQQDVWHELNGRSVMPLETDERAPCQSISKTKTFTPASNNPDYLFGQLSKNIENAFIKLRRHQLVAQECTFFLKTQDFKYAGIHTSFNRATAFPKDILTIAKQCFQQIYVPGTLYRATGVALSQLHADQHIQLDMFEPALTVKKMKQLYSSVDQLSKKYGKHTVFHGSSLPVHTAPDSRERYRKEPQKRQVMKINDTRKFVQLPYLGQAR